MRSAYATAIASLLLGCSVQASTQPPDAGNADGEVAAASTKPIPADEPAAASTPDDAGEPPTNAGGGNGEGEGEDGATALVSAETPDDGGADDGGTPNDGGAAADGDTKPTKPAGPTELARKPVVATLELPKPLHAGTDTKCGKDPGVGERLKSFSLPGLEEGKSVTQGTFRGRVLVVNFWGTWCKPCLKELPEFDQLYRRYRKHGMTLLAIATDEDAAAVQEVVDKRKLGAKIAIAGEDYAGQYGSPKFPFTFVVDYKGVIQASYRGYKPECMGQLEADIREQLQVRAEAKAKSAKGG